MTPLRPTTSIFTTSTTTHATFILEPGSALMSGVSFRGNVEVVGAPGLAGAGAGGPGLTGAGAGAPGLTGAGVGAPGLNGAGAEAPDISGARTEAGAPDIAGAGAGTRAGSGEGALEQAKDFADDSAWVNRFEGTFGLVWAEVWSGS